MNIASAQFLFLFLPAVIGVYYLIPRREGLGFRNLFLLISSIFFYTWGEPVIVLLFAAMVFLTWCFGTMAYGKKGSDTGKAAVFLTVLMNAIVLVYFGKQDFYLHSLGRLFDTDLSSLNTEFPVGFSFFVFSSISYVVDSYRGQCRNRGSVLDAALYTCIFFKLLQGPIISYRKFEPQIPERQESFDFVANGIWRFSLGLSKKIIIADNLSVLVDSILSSDFTAMPAGDAWTGCIAYLVYLYFDLSGYADMAIGLGQVFGFIVPENFNYPYISKSVSEFWRRWHITLCVWFTEYLYYPVLLGPSVRLRKNLLRHDVNPGTAKTVQNIFVTACVWLATALWHGMTLNYCIWGIANCAAILIEPHIKQLNRFDSAVRHAGLLFFLFLSMPLISLGSFHDAVLFYKAMFAGASGFSAYAYYGLQNYGLFLLAGIIGCFPVIPAIKNRFLLQTGTAGQVLWEVCSGTVMVLLTAASLYYLFTRGTAGFLYQQ